MPEETPTSEGQRVTAIPTGSEPERATTCPPPADGQDAVTADTPDGPESDAPQGSSGEASAGSDEADVDGSEDVDGDGVDGEDVDDEDVDGEDVDGDGVDGEDVDGEDVDGEDVDGEDVDGEDVDGEDVDGEDVDGEDVDGEDVDDDEGEPEPAEEVPPVPGDGPAPDSRPHVEEPPSPLRAAQASSDRAEELDEDAIGWERDTREPSPVEHGLDGLAPELDDQVRPRPFDAPAPQVDEFVPSSAAKPVRWDQVPAVPVPPPTAGSPAAGEGPPAVLPRSSEGPTGAVETAPSPQDLTPRRRLLVSMRPRATRAQTLAMALCFVLGLAGFIAVRQNQSLGLDSMRQSDLVSLLDNVTERSARVEDETRRLQEMADQLQSGSDRSAAALEAAQQRLEQLGILAGTSPAVGPGIQITISDPQHTVSAATVLDAVEELRDAGAEAIQIGPVRVVTSTAFVNGSTGVQVDGVDVSPPYVLLVIGDPQTLASALDIPGGVLEVLKQDGATGTVEIRQSVTVSAVRPVTAPQYARPATSAAP